MFCIVVWWCSGVLLWLVLICLIVIECVKVLFIKVEVKLLFVSIIFFIGGFFVFGGWCCGCRCCFRLDVENGSYDEFVGYICVVYCFDVGGICLLSCVRVVVLVVNDFGRGS